MIIINNSQGDWWEARLVSNNNTGYVPSNYVAPAESLEAQDWFCGMIRRAEAERSLANKAPGTFLIREAETAIGCYSMSGMIKALFKRFKHIAPLVMSPHGQVKHYRIRKRDNNLGFFISNRVVFTDMVKLVEHYRQSADGLCCQLKEACRLQDEQPLGLARDVWEINQNDLRLTEQLGRGMFGEVWKGFWNERVEVAVKQMRPGTMEPEAFRQEAEVMKTLRHPRLVSLYGVCYSEPLMIVTEFMVNGSLLTYLKEAEGGKKCQIPQLIDMGAQIAQGLAYIERMNYVHRDVRADNMLVGMGGQVKVADFGLARILEQDEYNPAHNNTKFPIKWTAPEAALYYKFTIKSDVWSFGILLTEIVTKGRTPYPGLNNRQTLEFVEGGQRMTKPAACPDHLWTITWSCWHEDPMKRPTFESLQNQLEDFVTGQQNQYHSAESQFS